MGKLNGLHHIAVSTGDIKKQIAFFSEVLGMELTGLFWMHGVEGAWHAFMQMGEEAFAFVFIPGNEDIEPVLGHSHAGHGANKSAPGTMQHIAMNVATQADLLHMRDRIRSYGVNVLGPIEHGFCTSIYFAGPEYLSLEVSTSDGAQPALTEDGTWIDLDVVELAGISPEELDRYRNPARFESGDSPVPQPPFDPEMPHLTFPEARYKKMLALSDEEYSARSSVVDPPTNSPVTTQ